MNENHVKILSQSLKTSRSGRVRADPKPQPRLRRAPNHVASTPRHPLPIARTRVHYFSFACAPSNSRRDRFYVPSDGETTQKLVAEGFALRDRAQPAVVDLFGVQLNSAFGKVETALHQRRKLANSSALLTEHVRSARGADDDFRAHRGHAHFHTRVAIFGEFADEHFIELGEEHAIGDELCLITIKPTVSHRVRARIPRRRRANGPSSSSATFDPKRAPKPRAIARAPTMRRACAVVRTHAMRERIVCVPCASC